MAASAESGCAGEVVRIAMLSGEKQLAEAQRQAHLQSRQLTQAEKDEIQCRRVHCSERRRAALAQAEQKSGFSASLQARITERHCALQAVEKNPEVVLKASATATLPTFGTHDESEDVRPQPATPEFGQAPASPRLPMPEPPAVESEERRRKSRRITFSAITGALDDLCPEQPAATSSIQVAQELAASVLPGQQYIPRFSLPGSSGGQASRGAKRSLDGVPRDSVGLEAMATKAKLLAARRSTDSSDGSDLEDSGSSLKEELPLLATPGRFRNRDCMGEATSALLEPFSSLQPKRSSLSGSGDALPPPPTRPPPQHPSKRATACAGTGAKS